MKRVISLLLVIFTISVVSQSVSAQTCNIKGSSGDTVQVFSSSLGNNSVEITLGSDSQYSATIDVTVTVTYTSTRTSLKPTRVFTKKCIAAPGQTTPVSVSIDSSFVDGVTYTPSSYSISLSGNKCE